MALIKCPDCGTDVSDAAPACLRCGRPLQAQPAPMETLRITQPPAAATSTTATRVLWRLVFLACSVMVVVWACGRVNDSDGSAAPNNTQTVVPASDDSADQAAAAAEQAAAAAAQAVEASVATPAPILTMTPTELLQRYQSNEVAADQYFSDKLIQVSAPVQSIDKDLTDSVVLHFATGNPADDFEATLDDSQKQLAAQLARGQTVTVQCKSMKRIMGSPMGSDCVLADSVPEVSTPAASQAPAQGAGG